MTGSMKTLVEEKMGKFPQFLIYAVLEWVIIILLFLDGFISFISNEFAKFFDLRIPCLLCTRIDHVLVHRNSNFYYNDSVCEAHKKDISSLAYCHVHKKLSDIRSMCDGCLLSFATEKDSDRDRYRSLVGILRKDVDCFVEDDPKNFLKSGKKDDTMQVDMTGVPRCCCCGDPLKVRPSSKFIRSSSMNAYAPTPSPRAPLLSWKNEEPRNPELPHMRYTELKIISDNDQLELLEDEDVTNGDNQRKEDIKAVTVPLLPEPEDANEDSIKTPVFGRGNKFFGISLSDSAQASPRYKAAGSRRLSMDKPEFGLEPNDINALNDTDDSILNRLKKQVRVDRKSLIALYMELDEERSASAIAANNAMAMITRLQADKAAVQMEALQYQRMMDEQAEYDQEAVQVMKDLVLKREEEVKVLELDLEAYREKYGPIRKIGSEVCEIDDEDYQELKSQSPSSCGEKSECGSPSELIQNGEILDESTLDFESERSYLLNMLKDLERNMNATSEEGSNSSEPNMIKQEEQNTGNENKPILARELSMIRERLRAIEAESGFLKHATMTLQKSGEGAKLLTEIAQHLRKLRHSANIPSEDAEARPFG